MKPITGIEELLWYLDYFLSSFAFQLNAGDDKLQTWKMEIQELTLLRTVWIPVVQKQLSPDDCTRGEDRSASHTSFGHFGFQYSKGIKIQSLVTSMRTQIEIACASMEAAPHWMQAGGYFCIRRSRYWRGRSRHMREKEFRKHRENILWESVLRRILIVILPAVQSTDLIMIKPKKAYWLSL